MAWIRVSSCLLAVLLLIAPLSSACPDSCVCNNTPDGLHRATCSSLSELYKFSLRQKHHNINILDLSHNNITKLSHELDRLTEVVTLDLSTNGIAELNKFLHNAKKLVHLNLANNRIEKLSLTHLPASVSSLDLTNNLLQDVPSDLGHLTSLEHLEMDGNPLDCSCANIRTRDRLLSANVFIDKVKCVTPSRLVGRSWLEIKTKDICKVPKIENDLDMMMGDQPIDAVRVGEETTALKSMPIVWNSAADNGNIIKGESPAEEDDSLLFMKVGRNTPSSSLGDIEGSGEGESTTMPSDLLIKTGIVPNIHVAEEIVSENEQSTDDPIEGSGEEGSGIILSGFGMHELETSTPVVEDLTPGRVKKYFDDDESSSTEYPLPIMPNVYEGGQDWHNHTEAPFVEKVATPLNAQDTTVSDKIIKVDDLAVKTVDDQPTPHKTGTYICIAIIVVLLVGLIGFAIIKGQMRKRRDRRLLRQQKRDVEKASKEMVDMNKSLLGKPAIVDSPAEKKLNGKYELVPTHEPHLKKSENGDIGNGIKHADTNGLRTDSPRDTNQNKSSSKDNNLADEHPAHQDNSFELAPASPDSKKDTDSLSSDDMFIPLNDDEPPRLNGNADSDISQPLINGDQTTDSDFLSPSREYVPVYSPDMGRVRIKMTEMPKPKTPVLVTRSRSNAGDIILIPSSADANALKSTT